MRGAERVDKEVNNDLTRHSGVTQRGRIPRHEADSGVRRRCGRPVEERRAVGARHRGFGSYGPAADRRPGRRCARHRNSDQKCLSPQASERVNSRGPHPRRLQLVGQLITKGNPCRRLNAPEFSCGDQLSQAQRYVKTRELARRSTQCLPQHPRSVSYNSSLECRTQKKECGAGAGQRMGVRRGVSFHAIR